MQRDPARLKHEIDRFALVELRLQQLLVQREIGARIGTVREQPCVAVGAPDETQAAVLGGRVVDCDPDRAGCQRSNGPVLAVLMPWCGVAVDGRLGEEARVPQREVRSQYLFHHVQDRRYSGVVEERQVECEHIGTVVDELRMAGEQPIVILTDRLDGLVREAVVGNDESVFTVLVQLGLRQHLLRTPSIGALRPPGAGCLRRARDTIVQARTTASLPAINRPPVRVRAERVHASPSPADTPDRCEGQWTPGSRGRRPAGR